MGSWRVGVWLARCNRRTKTRVLSRERCAEGTGLGAGWERTEGKAKKELLDGEKLAGPGARSLGP